MYVSVLVSEKTPTLKFEIFTCTGGVLLPANPFGMGGVVRAPTIAM